MTKQTRNTATGLVILATMFAVSRSAAAADGGATAAAVSALSTSLVRSSNPAIGALIREAAERSATFRGLVETIDASDGIVYVESGQCGHGVRACLAGVTGARGHRILHIKVDIRKAEWDLMGSIGHELRHAVEVLGEPTVTSNAAMYLFYKRIGQRGTRSAFETRDAFEAGEAVRAEVRRALRPAQAR
jgi:hypothetical protein